MNWPLVIKIQGVPLVVYLALFIAVFLEGELILISAIIAAHHDHLPLMPVVVTGFFGALSSDLFYFNIGRTNGVQWLTKRKAIASKMMRAGKLMDRSLLTILFTYRFMYRVRVIILILAATNGVKPRLFTFYAIFGTVIWCGVLTLLGVALGETMVGILKYIEHFEKYVIALVASVGIALAIRNYLCRHHKQAITTNSTG